MFIASRNQVDKDEFGGGYVNGWDQFRFAKAVEEVAEKFGDTITNIIYVEIMEDHGKEIKKEMTIFQKKKQCVSGKNHT